MIRSVNDDLATDSAGGTTSRTLICLALILAGAAALRFCALGRHEFRLDEVLSWYCSHNLFDWPQDGPDVRRELTSIPYFFALSVWSRLFGESESAMRSLSTIFSLMTVAVLALSAHRSGGRRAAVVCALLAAVNPLAIWYSQLVRVYALWTLILALSGLLLFRAATKGTRRCWALYGAVLFVALTTHYFTIFWVPFTLLCLLVCGSSGTTFRRWVVTHFLVGAAFLPIFVTCVIPVASRGSGAWLVEYWAAHNHFLAVPASIGAFIPAGEPPDYLHTFTWSLMVLREAGWGWLAGVAKWTGALVLIVLAWGLRKSLRQRGGNAQSNRELRELFFWVGLSIGPLVLSWLYSTVVRPNYLVGRYDMMSWPAWMVAVSLLVGRGALGPSVRPTVATSAAAILLALGSSVYVLGMFRVEAAGTVRDKVGRLIGHAGNDARVIMAADQWELLYELHRRGFTGRLIPFPSRLERQIGWRDVGAELADPESLEREADELASRILVRARAGKPTWLLVRNYASENDPVYNVDRVLFAALNRSGMEIGIIDSELGLARLLPGGRKDGQGEKSNEFGGTRP